MEGQDVVRNVVGMDSLPLQKTLIYQYFDAPEKVGPLLRSFYAIIRSSGILQLRDGSVQEIAREMLGEIVEEALTHSDRYDPARQLGPWLYGIGVNILNRKKVTLAKQTTLESSFSDLQQNQDTSHEDEAIDQLLFLVVEGPEQTVEFREQIRVLFTSLSEDDRSLLRLIVIYGSDTKQLAKELSITSDAARQRIHRVRTRVRRILEEQGGKYDG